MDHLQLASQGSPTTPSKMLTQHTGDPLGGRTYQRQCSEGRQQKQLHHYIDATPTSVDWTYRLHAQHTSPQTDLFRTTSRPTCGSSVTVDDWEFIALERRLWNEVTKAQLLMSLNYVMSQTQSDNSKKKDGQRLQPHHTLMWPPQPSQDPPGAPSEDRHTRFRVTADDFVSARLQLHKSRT